MTYADLLTAFKSKTALVVGDLMLDEYIHGRATRISPEAPVMVVRQHRTTAVPGGAANVVKNLHALGATTRLVGVVGDDASGRLLGELLDASDSKLVVDPSRPTTRKTRVLADSAHQVLRIDHEDDRPVSEDIESRLLEAIRLSLDGVDLVVLSDYVKGALTPRLISETIRMAHEAGAKCVANAKPASMSAYRGADLVSLNRPEAAAAAGLRSIDGPRHAIEVAGQLRESTGVHHVLVTLGGDGMATEHDYTPPVRVDVFDTAGAGDTTIATVALGLTVADIAPVVFGLAAETAAAVVRRVGVAVPSEKDLAEIATR